jgi:hypothetical protein
MPQIEISDTSLALLKRHAEPLVDTCDTIILKFGHAFEASLRDGQTGVPRRAARLPNSFPIPKLRKIVFRKKESSDATD